MGSRFQAGYRRMTAPWPRGAQPILLARYNIVKIRRRIAAIKAPRPIGEIVLTPRRGYDLGGTEGHCEARDHATLTNAEQLTRYCLRDQPAIV